MATPADFAKNIRRVAARVVENTDAGWRATAIAVDQAVVVGTPVDTGRARSNWRVGVGAPITDEVEAFEPGEKGSTTTQNTNEVLAQGKRAIEEAKVEDRELYISNNLDYIEQLNAGSSAQAPAGFVEDAVSAGQEAVKKIRLLEGS